MFIPVCKSLCLTPKYSLNLITVLGQERERRGSLYRIVFRCFGLSEMETTSSPLPHQKNLYSSSHGKSTMCQTLGWVLSNCTNVLGLPRQSSTTGWLEQQKLIFSQFWKLEDQDQDVNKACFLWEPQWEDLFRPLFLAHRCLLSASSLHDCSSLYVHPKWIFVWPNFLFL